MDLQKLIGQKIVIESSYYDEPKARCGRGLPPDGEVAVIEEILPGFQNIAEDESLKAATDYGVCRATDGRRFVIVIEAHPEGNVIRFVGALDMYFGMDGRWRVTTQELKDIRDIVRMDQDIEATRQTRRMLEAVEREGLL